MQWLGLGHQRLIQVSKALVRGPEVRTAPSMGDSKCTYATNVLSSLKMGGFYLQRSMLDCD